MTKERDSERYRLFAKENISEALWQEAQAYGVRLAVDEQVAVAVALASRCRNRPGRLKPKDFDEVFARFGLRVPPRGYGTAVSARLERLSR